MQALIPPLLLVGLVLYVAWPFFREETRSWEEDGEAEPLARLTAEKEEALENLKDIEMDFRMGKLSEEDYRRLREEWEMKAVAVLEQLDRLKGRGRKSSRRG
ncbi:MAG: hypothetical protein Kow00109_04720 [Acidobacteriota bacterium]